MIECPINHPALPGLFDPQIPNNPALWAVLEGRHAGRLGGSAPYKLVGEIEWVNPVIRHQFFYNSASIDSGSFTGCWQMKSWQTYAVGSSCSSGRSLNNAGEAVGGG